jgi:hypothetical protein
MSYFLKTGNTYRVASDEAMDIHRMLPAGNYVVKVNEMSGELYLEHIDGFAIPSKIYGNCLKNTDKIIRTFLDREHATGVMMTGEKGSGKTLLTKNVAIQLANQGVPTIVINQPWCGDKFNTFIQNIEQPCAILFDEFEKTYDKDQQESILTLLDGVFPTKKLFMITCNDKWRVDSHMRNRPGRIYYMLDFKGLDETFIREYCYDNLKDPSLKNVDSMVNIGSLFGEFNFDMLKAIVEEMNRYNESPQEALEMLNAKPEFDNGTEYAMKIVHNGKEVKSGTCDKFHGNPLQPKGVEVEFDSDPDDEESEYIWKTFKPDALIHVDGRKGEFTFKDNGTTVVLTRIEKTMYRMYDAF